MLRAFIPPFSPLLVMCADWSLNCAERRMCLDVDYMTTCVLVLQWCSGRIRRPGCHKSLPELEGRKCEKCKFATVESEEKKLSWTAYQKSV